MGIGMDRLHCCCFTGHRPEKLRRSEEQVKALLRPEINRAVADGFNVFISGMAQGTDIWAAEVVLEKRDKGMPVKLICARPYAGQEKEWTQDWEQRYDRVLSKADDSVIICPAASDDCFIRRDKWMVDHSSRVIAVYEGKPGGTEDTIRYAASTGVECHIV